MPNQSVTPNLTRIATVRFHPDEYASLLSESSERGITVSDLIRKAALGRELPPQRVPCVDAQMVTALNRIGSNLNQSVHTFNRWEFTEPAEKREAWQRWKLGIRDLAGTLKDLEERLLQ